VQTLIRDKGKLAQLHHRSVSAMETRNWPINIGYVSVGVPGWIRTRVTPCKRLGISSVRT
jgi:hypothetical protein